MVNFNPPTKDDGQNNKLVYFVTFTFDILSISAVGDFPHNKQIFFKALVTPMREAMVELKPQVNVLIEKVKVIQRDQLIEHGLNGKQLDFKFAVVKRHFNRFVKSGGARLLKNLLQVLDTTLDSIIVAAGVGGALKEFKEAVANSTLIE